MSHKFSSIFLRDVLILKDTVRSSPSYLSRDTTHSFGKTVNRFSEIRKRYLKIRISIRIACSTNFNYPYQLAVLPVQQCFGLIFKERFSDLGITATQTSLILHLNGTITCSLGLISGPMMRRFAFRKVACFGGLTVVLGICAAAFAMSLPSLIVTYCIIIGRWFALPMR